MSDNMAQDYAESVGRGFWAAVENDAPFGRRECEDCGADENTSCEHDIMNERVIDVYDWLDDVLEIDYIISGHGTYKGAEVWIAYGGPNAWIDTRERNVQVRWSERGQWSIPSSVIDALDEVLEELWESSR